MADNTAPFTYLVTVEEVGKYPEDITIKASSFDVGADVVVFNMPHGANSTRPNAAFPLKSLRRIVMIDPPATPPAS